MKLTRITILLFAAIFMCGIQVYAQLPTSAENLKTVKVDDLTDLDIQEYYQKAAASGLTTQQMLKMAADRGMPAQEVAKLQQRIEALGKVNANSGSKTDNRANSGSNRLVDDDAMKIPSKKLNRDFTIFGSEFFAETNSVFEPNLRIPSPANYILGPDDQLTINVFGYSEQTYNLSVNAEGNIYIPNVGPIKVSGISIEEASAKIKNKLAATIYRAISSGQTRVEVSLGKIRSIRVTVIGQATTPGTLTVSSLTTLFNLLYQCGGPSDMGSFRSIELIRGNQVIRTVDLYAFLLRGDRKDNVLLQEQDVVRIPYYGTRVAIEGAVKRPGKFELLPAENFDQLLTYSGGFADSAYRSLVKVTRLSDDGIILSDITANDFGSFAPRTGDAYFVSKGLNRFTNRVTIKGAVMRPGSFELKPGMTIQSLIALAGGLREDAFADRGFVARLNEDLTQSSVSFGVKQAAAGEENVLLKKEDIVNITSIFDLKDKLTLTIEGEVRNQGAYEYREQMSLRDLILQSGGFTEAANSKVVEISRRIRNPDVTQLNFQQTKIIQVDLSGGIASVNGETKLEPFDMVIVRPEAGFNTPRSVYVEGQVMNTGRYVLAASGERMSQLLKRAGGFKGAADSSSVTIRRVVRSGISQEERQKIVQRMLDIDPDSLMVNSKLRDTYLKDVELLSVNVQKIKEKPGGNEDVILEDGDYITIARASSLVRVSGEVFHPTLLPYEDGSSAKYYIRRSGSFTSNARKSAVFVIYPDGRAKSVKQFLWFKNYPQVTPRAEVWIPAKDKDNRKRFGTGEWIAFSSVLASLATMAIAIVNATK